MDKKEIINLIARANNFLTEVPAKSLSLGKLVEVSNLLRDLQVAHNKLREECEQEDSNS